MEKPVQLLKGRLIVSVGDLTKVQVDAIVNAANSSLLGGGGVDGAIHRAAGNRLMDECMALRSGPLKAGLPPGEAIATGAGKLSCRAIIHTVGPVWDGGGHGEACMLESCYRESLKLAAERGFQSIAFPAISTGVYGYPREEAAKVVGKVLLDFLNANPLPSEVRLVFFTRVDAEIFLAESGLAESGLAESGLAESGLASD